MNNKLNRRLSARIKGNFDIIITDNNDKVSVNTIDLSSSGLRFKSTKNIPLFREIALSLSLPLDNKKSNNFKCNAIVVRSEKSHYNKSYNIALTFVHVDNKDKKLLDSFLKKLTK